MIDRDVTNRGSTVNDKNERKENRKYGKEIKNDTRIYGNDMYR